MENKSLKTGLKIGGGVLLLTSLIGLGKLSHFPERLDSMLEDPSSFIIYAVFFVFLLVFALFYRFLMPSIKIENSQKTAGIVTDKLVSRERKYDRETGRVSTSYSCTIEYNYAVEGEVHLVKTPYGSSSLCKYGIGEEIEVLYDRDDPSHSVLAKEHTRGRIIKALTTSLPFAPVLALLGIPIWSIAVFIVGFMLLLI